MMSMVMVGNTKTMFTKTMFTKTMFTKTIMVTQMLTHNPHNVIFSKKRNYYNNLNI